ncbi:MAG: SDR family NAD(P)-dependent oxidoreductase [Alphaproteobacteria bacterium]|nr:SDR family NAD(P)-dependent oxidoreductase [Alphaproteobacteria bacterium]
MPLEKYIPQTVLITGATGDFGKAFAQRFAALGSKVILIGRNREKLESLQNELEATTHIAAFDMKDKEGMSEAISNLPEEFKNIDLLINNAGLALGLDPAYKCEIEDWETMIAVNNTALVQMTRLILPVMVANQKGHIINIGSIAGNYYYPGGNVYCASKAFVKQFSMCLRADLTGTKVRVTNIEPGAIKTQFSEVRFKGDKARADAVYDNTNNMTAEDVAEAVTWSACLPPHFNVNRMEIMATVQSFGPLTMERFDEGQEL